MSDIRSQIKFGTDGWRAVISDTFTFENVRIVAQAVADWIIKNNSQFQQKSASVGYDNRFLSVEYAQAVAEVFAGNGIKTFLSDTSLPTPTLSLGVVDLKNVCGIMITASHNPAKFNGIKIKTAQGGAASKDITNTVEGYLGQTPVKSLPRKEAAAQGLIVVHDFKKAYVKFLRGYLNLKKMKTAKYKVLADIMHGSGRDLMREILKGTAIKLTLMREDVNPGFDGSKPEPIPECLEKMMGRMKKEKFDFGHVLDGDADRIAAVMPGGEFVSPQKILGLLILHLVRNRKVEGGIIKTLCGTTMLDHIAQKLGRKLYETPVGFKYISDLMISEKIVAGGEEAGGMGLPNYIPERDGTLAGLLLLEMMVYNKRNFKQLVQDMEAEFGRYYYLRLDYATGKQLDLNKLKTVPTVLGKKVVEVKDFDGVKLICENEDWLMFRPSGTEPLVRIYSEAKSLKRSKDILEFGRQQVGPNKMIYWFTYFCTKVMSWLWFPFTAYQTKNIPRQGAFILASNHISNLDPVLLGICSVRRLDFMAKIELFKGALGFFLRHLGAYPVKRGESDFGAMKESLKRLKKGRVVLIFVEGTRRIGNEPTKAQAGVGFLALRSGVPIVPVYVQGTNKVMAPGAKFFKRGRVFATYGEPFFIKEAPSYEEASQRILDKIYALAPG